MLNRKLLVLHYRKELACALALNEYVMYKKLILIIKLQVICIMPSTDGAGRYSLMVITISCEVTSRSR